MKITPGRNYVESSVLGKVSVNCHGTGTLWHLEKEQHLGTGQGMKVRPPRWSSHHEAPGGAAKAFTPMAETEENEVGGQGEIPQQEVGRKTFQGNRTNYGEQDWE